MTFDYAPNEVRKHSQECLRDGRSEPLPYTAATGCMIPGVSMGREAIRSLKQWRKNTHPKRVRILTQLLSRELYSR